MRASSSMIQATLRGHKQRNLYRRALLAVEDIQRVTRGSLVRKQVNLLIDQARRHMHAAVNIQSAWRRSYAQTNLYASVRAATLFQSLIRMEQARRETRNRAFQKLSSIRIQTFLRRIQCQDEFHLARASVVSLQSWTRKTLAARRSASLRFEKAHRRTLAAVRIQSTWRRKTEQRHLHLSVQAATLLQSCVRVVQARQQYAMEQSERSLACVQIQTVWRKFQCQDKFDRSRALIILLQVSARFMIISRRYQARRRSVILIQRCYGEFCLRNSIRAATFVQACWRGSLARSHYSVARVSTVIIQATVRGAVLRRTYLAQHDAVIRIQTTFRSSLRRQESAAASLQRCVRAWRSRKAYSLTLRRRWRAASKIQSKWRGFVARQLYIATLHAVVLIQAIVRTRQASRRFLKVTSATKIQSIYRRNTDQIVFKQQQREAIRIQRYVRALAMKRRLMAVRIAERLADQKVTDIVAFLDTLEMKSGVRVECLLQNRVQRDFYGPCFARFEKRIRDFVREDDHVALVPSPALSTPWKKTATPEPSKKSITPRRSNKTPTTGSAHEEYQNLTLSTVTRQVFSEHAEGTPNLVSCTAGPSSESRNAKTGGFRIATTNAASTQYTEPLGQDRTKFSEEPTAAGAALSDGRMTLCHETSEFRSEIGDCAGEECNGLDLTVFFDTQEVLPSPIKGSRDWDWQDAC